MNRRSFVFRTLFSAALGIAVRPALSASKRSGDPEEKNNPSSLPRVTDPGEMRGEMLYRKLGSTGESVSAIGLGGSHIGKPVVTEAEATRLIHQAIDRGLTFMDNSWDYNEGQSECAWGMHSQKADTGIRRS